MRSPSYSGQFRRDVKLAEKRGKDMKKLCHVISLLLAGETLPRELGDHPLKGPGHKHAALCPRLLGKCHRIQLVAGKRTIPMPSATHIKTGTRALYAAMRSGARMTNSS